MRLTDLREYKNGCFNAALADIRSLNTIHIFLLR